MKKYYRIGELAEQSGASVKTIRFYADKGLLGQVQRSDTGQRLFDAFELERLRLILALREFDVALEKIQALLSGATDLNRIIELQLKLLGLQIKTLQRKQALLSAILGESDELRLEYLQLLAAMEKSDQDEIFTQFWDDALQYVSDATTADRFRQFGTVVLPENPSKQQVKAWVELNQLLRDEKFLYHVKKNSQWFWHLLDQQQVDVAARNELFNQLRNISHGKQERQQFVRTFAKAMGRVDGIEFRHWLLQMFSGHQNPQAQRYWDLVALVNKQQKQNSGFDELLCELKNEIEQKNVIPELN